MRTTETGDVELQFVDPMVGFPEHHRFALVPLDEAAVVFALRSLDDPGLRFIVVPAETFFPSYVPELDEDWAARLELSDARDAQVLLVVTPGDPVANSTANLLAPVIVNTRTGKAAQVLLAADLPLRAPLHAASVS